MPVIGHIGPLIPPEWIAAHGLVPARLLPAAAIEPAPAAGVCPAAAGWCATLAAQAGRLAGAVLPSTCDQLRRAAEGRRERIGLPLFVFNVPATRAATARRIYGDELRRLSRFLLRAGGHDPAPELLAAARRRDDAGRRRRPRPAGKGARVGLLGCTLGDADAAVLELLAAAGLEIALDATDGGSRTWPAPLDETLLRQDPVEALTRAWLDFIPTVAQRPNAPLFDWVGRQGAAAGLAGWVLLRRPWCDLWHAEAPRLRACAGLPLLDLEADPCAPAARLRTRAEAFAETLRDRPRRPPRKSRR